MHKIKNCNTHNSKSEITNYSNDEYSNSNIFGKNDIAHNINNQNSYSRNNYYENFYNPRYSYNENFPFFSWDPPNKQKERLTLDEKIKIQKILKKLAIQLYKHGCTPNNANQIAKFLYYRCLKERNDEPLKRFLTIHGLGDLWE